MVISHVCNMLWLFQVYIFTSEAQANIAYFRYAKNNSYFYAVPNVVAFEANLSALLTLS